MPNIATESARVRCSHGMGYAKPVSSRPFLRINGKPVLVDVDMSGNSISLCPNYGPTTKPCQTTLALAKGRSSFVFANGRPVVFHAAIGPTDGIPPGITTWSVLDAGQDLVKAGG